MRLKWRKARPEKIDSFLRLNGAYTPPDRFELFNPADGAVYAIIQRLGAGYRWWRLGNGSLTAPLGSFSDLTIAKANAKEATQNAVRMWKG